jgi:hypothetical protein
MDGPAWQFTSNPYTFSPQYWGLGNGHGTFYIYHNATNSVIWRDTLAIKEC